VKWSEKTMQFAHRALLLIAIMLAALVACSGLLPKG
jgi:hypothetical protein